MAIGIFYFYPGEKKIRDFIAAHPEQVALLWIRNGDTLAAWQTEQKKPLASVMKIMVAIGYAQQAAEGQLDPDERISLEALENFYVPKTDGGAHAAWLKSLEGKMYEGKVPLREVVKGMMQFSSNANTEWLMAKIGLDYLNATPGQLGIMHDSMYYLVSSLFIAQATFPALTRQALEDSLKNLPPDRYKALTREIHQQLLSDPSYRFGLTELGLGIQKIWSDRLPGSTAAAYTKVVHALNDRSFFAPEVYPFLTEVMETVMEKPENQQWLQHSGMKGGSTAFVLNKALYATDKNGNKTILVYLIDGLNPLDMLRLQFSMNDFELAILQKGGYEAELNTQAFGL